MDMMKRSNPPITRPKLRNLACLAILVAVLSACQPAWQLEVRSGETNPQIVNRENWRSWQEQAWEGATKDRLPLEYILYELGYELVENIRLRISDGEDFLFAWSAVASDAWLLKDGTIEIGDRAIAATSLDVEPPLSYYQVSASIRDIAPSAAAALGLPAPAQATGTVLTDQKAEHILLLFLDGFGYQRYLHALEQDAIPFLASLEPPLMALTTYPPVTRVSSASVLTGAPPAVHGVNGKEGRKTETETLLDVAAQNGLQVQAVEGEALAFELRNAPFKLSGDRNGDGSTDDEVLANTLAVLQQGAPELFWVHFHGIDDAGHSYGPGTPEETDVVRKVDQSVETLLQALPPGWLVFIFADHGQHMVQEAERYGNHGNLIEEDMLIPIFILTTP